jgi:pimeloyl-ACP methyl ester carboxylesterase
MAGFFLYPYIIALMQLLIDGLLTNYTITNPSARQTLLILHGWGHNQADWQQVAKGVSSDIRVISLDLPAFGSTQPFLDQSGTPTYSHFVRSFIKKLKISSLSILGHSFGGQIAVDYAINYPKGLNHLLLLSPACIRNSKPSLKSQTISAMSRILAPVVPTIKRIVSQTLSSADYAKATPKQKQVLNLILRQDYTQKLHHIQAPTTIIWGTEDHLIPNTSKFLTEKIPNANLVVLYGQGHNPHLEAPDKTICAINDTLIK